MGKNVDLALLDVITQERERELKVKKAHGHFYLKEFVFVNKRAR